MFLRCPASCRPRPASATSLASASAPRQSAPDCRPTRHRRCPGATSAREVPMIRKFTTVYPGHIDLPDHGQDATPANERRYDNDLLASVFEKSEAIAQLMDRTGWDTLWLAEHHFQVEGYEVMPNLLMAAVHLCHLTHDLKIGCGFNIAPMW